MDRSLVGRRRGGTAGVGLTRYAPAAALEDPRSQRQKRRDDPRWQHPDPSAMQPERDCDPPLQGQWQIISGKSICSKPIRRLNSPMLVSRLFP